jgi:undecaprenyl-diphosphatase
MVLSSILSLDISVFEFINGYCSNIVLDIVCPIIRNKFTWIPVYLFVLTYIFYSFKIKKAIVFLLFFIFTIVLADGISSHLIKKKVKRLRPCNSELVQVIERIECGSGYSFTSSHSTNHFAISFFLLFLLAERKWIKYLLIGWAVSIAFSQVYVGVHYPSDVIAGGILGVTIAYLTSILYKKLNRYSSQL